MTKWIRLCFIISIVFFAIILAKTPMQSRSIQVDKTTSVVISSPVTLILGKTAPVNLRISFGPTRETCPNSARISARIETREPQPQTAPLNFKPAGEVSAALLQAGKRFPQDLDRPELGLICPLLGDLSWTITALSDHPLAYQVWVYLQEDPTTERTALAVIPLEVRVITVLGLGRTGLLISAGVLMLLAVVLLMLSLRKR